MMFKELLERCVESCKVCYFTMSVIAKAISLKQKEQTLAVLYRVADLSPHLYNEKLTNLLSSFVEADPFKVLNIIQKYSENFQNVENPWDVIDILVKKNTYFIKSNSSYFYLKICHYILSTFVEYRDNRAEEFTSVFLNSLASEDPKTVSAGYKCLALYATEPINLEFCAPAHVMNDEIRSSLLQCIFQKECVISPEGMRYLIQYAASSPSPELFYVLFKFSLTPKGAEALISNNYWMSAKSKIGIVQAMRIFLAILTHKKLRSTFAKSSETALFIKRLCVLKHLQITLLISTIVKALLVDANSIPPFEQIDFLTSYFNMCSEINKKQSYSAFIKTLDSFLKIGYSSEYIKLIPIMKKLLKREDQAAIYAVGLVAQMSNYKECANALSKAGFPKYFSKLQKTGFYDKEIRLFQKNMGKK